MSTASQVYPQSYYDTDQDYYDALVNRYRCLVDEYSTKLAYSICTDLYDELLCLKAKIFAMEITLGISVDDPDGVGELPENGCPALPNVVMVEQNNKIITQFIGFVDSGETPEALANTFTIEVAPDEIYVLTTLELVDESATSVTKVRKYLLKPGKGTYGVNGIAITSADLELIYESGSGTVPGENSPIGGTVVELGDIDTTPIHTYIGGTISPDYDLQENILYFFKATIGGIDQTYLYKGPLPVLLGSNGIQPQEENFQLVTESSEGGTVLADNGLTKVGDTILLGGALTGTTQINQGSFNFEFLQSGASTLSITKTGLGTTSISGGNISSGNSIFNGSAYQNNAGNNGFVYIGTPPAVIGSGGSITGLGGVLRLQPTYSDYSQAIVGNPSASNNRINFLPDGSGVLTIGINHGAGIKQTANDGIVDLTDALNTRDADNRDRANHTGTQAISTIDGLAEALGSSGFIVIDDGFNWSTIPASYEGQLLDIRGTFDMAGGNISFPKDAQLYFNGGSISNYGTLTFNNTLINANYQIFDGSGSFAGTLLSEAEPEWFGAISGDDTIDDRPAFQFTSDMLNDIGGGIFRIKGSYYLDSRDATGYAVEIFSNTTLIGEGIFKSRVKLGDNVPEDTPIFITNSASNLEFARFEIDGNKQRHSSTGTPEDEGIDIKGGSNVTIRNMYIHDCFTDAIDFDQVTNVGSSCIIINNIIKDCGGYAIHNNWTDSIVSGNVVENCGQQRFDTLELLSNDTRFDVAGIDIRNNNAIITGNSIKNCVKGLSISQGNKAIITDNIFENNGDVAIGLGSLFLGSQPVNITISDNTMSDHIYGVYVEDTGDKCIIANNTIQTNGTNNAGIYVKDCTDLKIDGGTYQGFYSIQVINNSGELLINGATFKGTQTGVRIETGANNVIIQNCYDNIVSGVGVVDLRGLVDGTIIKNNNFLNRQGVRMLNSGGNPSNSVIKNNEMTGMTVVGSGHVIERNSGYVTENRGTGSIVSGNSNVVINHGLSKTPNIVVASPTANQMIWVVNLTATTFQVNRAVTAGTLNFNWIAE